MGGEGKILQGWMQLPTNKQILASYCDFDDSRVNHNPEVDAADLRILFLFCPDMSIRVRPDLLPLAFVAFTKCVVLIGVDMAPWCDLSSANSFFLSRSWMRAAVSPFGTWEENGIQQERKYNNFQPVGQLLPVPSIMH